jgi:hypothetical protein
MSDEQSKLLKVNKELEGKLNAVKALVGGEIVNTTVACPYWMSFGGPPMKSGYTSIEIDEYNRITTKQRVRYTPLKNCCKNRIVVYWQNYKPWKIATKDEDNNLIVRILPITDTSIDATEFEVRLQSLVNQAVSASVSKTSKGINEDGK